jgi:hypothetical protein
MGQGLQHVPVIIVVRVRERPRERPLTARGLDDFGVAYAAACRSSERFQFQGRSSAIRLAG